MGAEAEAAFWGWLRDYVMRGHPQIGRRGAVCPFVPGIVKRDGLAVEVETELDGTDEQALERRIREAIPRFLAMPQAPTAKSLVLLFPAIAEERGEVIDRVQSRLKAEIVGMGMMAGNFHARSTEPGARNEAFFANRSPMPLLVLRHMAVHDILFLGGRREWFLEYQARFGAEITSGRLRDPYIVGRYAEAVERFAPQAA